ncbi:hypothetical protein [Acinetobacter sp. ANC 4648]|uniref:hypothetical protein n=1 Tax=Acinetobacter sp. ANC 4648 TaxID=1977875 RepID=UPI000A339B1C|nr:hypothetical protein [Acinetobacter sp. ANC 4648]OTG83696.1 hypothetical protein B9T27_04075 [Acinetobacter sp. ANC 4648]
MKEEIRIAIFGLSLNVLENMKQKVHLMYDDTIHIHWANIADPKLNILLVNDMFFASPTIQNLVGTQKIPYLRLINKQDKSGRIEGDKLFLPFIESDEIRKWFKDRYLQVPVNPKVERVIAYRAKSLDIHKVIQEFLNERNGNLQIFDSYGNIALMNTRTEQIWMEQGKNIQSTDTTLNYTYATMQKAQSVSDIQGLDLRYWLWNTLWRSESLVKDSSSKVFYKLQYWPQPSTAKDRQDIFKIAACFERGASMVQIEKKLGISMPIIQKFVSTALFANVLKEIDESEAQLIIQTKPTESTLRGFFGKLRLKLGL